MTKTFFEVAFKQLLPTLMKPWNQDDAAEDDEEEEEDLDQPVLEPLHPGDDVEQVESSHDRKREQAQADDSHQGWASIVLRLVKNSWQN